MTHDVKFNGEWTFEKYFIALKEGRRDISLFWSLNIFYEVTVPGIIDSIGILNLRQKSDVGDAEQKV